MLQPQGPYRSNKRLERSASGSGPAPFCVPVSKCRRGRKPGEIRFRQGAERENPAISRRFRHVRAPCRKITHPLTPYLRKHENPSTKSKMAHFSAWLWAFRCRNVLFDVESEQITFLAYARNGAEKHVVVFGACRRNVEIAGREIPFRSCYNGGRRMRQ